jgi:hypothetical protein
MNRTRIILLVVAAMLMVVLACQVDFSQVDEDAVADAVAQTLEAQQPPPEVPPPAPPEPTATPQPADEHSCDWDRCDEHSSCHDCYYHGYTECNQAEFISETVRDYSDMYPGEHFTKVWRVKNIGYCTWTTDYRLAIQSGDSMGIHHAQYFPEEVKPGECVDITLDLRAPHAYGQYTSFWQLQDEHGWKFGQLYLIIDVW